MTIFEHRPLENRHSVVIGGGGGIGRNVALRLARDGAKVLIADTRVEAAQSVAAEISEAGGSSVSARCDVTNENDVATTFARAQADFGSVDLFVGLAGIIEYGQTDELDLDSWNRVLNVNLMGTFLSCKYALQAFLAAGKGLIFTVGSTSGFVERAGTRAASYGASKAAVISLTRSLAVNYADRNIRANCVRPGGVDTGFFASTGNKSPMQRLAQPSEISEAISFLASDEASYISGAALLIDGGLTAT